jgi:hypothetical protein
MPGPGFTQTFGGNLLYPSQTNLLSLDPLTASVVLQWPIEQSSGGAPIVADIVEVVASTGGLTLSFSDARQATTGYTALFNNIGANTFTVLDNLGDTLASIASGQAWLIYLADNSTQAGVWRIFQMGAGTSSAKAAALAGAGLIAITTTLNENMVVNDQSADYTSVIGDRATIIDWTGGTGTIELASAVPAGWFVMVKNSGTGNVTVTPPTGTIDGGSDLIFGPDTSAFIVFDGTNWITIGFGQQLNSIFDFIQINLTGDSGNFVLTGAQLNRIAYRFIGALAGNINIIVPNTIQEYWIDNETTGAFTLTVKTAAGSGIAVAQGTRNILYSDGANVFNAVSFGSTGFTNGTAASPSIFFQSDPGTGLFLASAGNIGLSTEGVQRLNIDATGHWIVEAPSTAASPTLTINGNSAGSETTVLITTPFTGLSTSPQLALQSTASNGFAELSIAGNGVAPGTTDLSIFQNGTNATGNILNRASASLNFGTNGVIDMTLQAGGGLFIDTPTVSGATLQLQPGNTQTTLFVAAATGELAAVFTGVGANTPGLVAIQDGQAGVRVWQLRAGAAGVGEFDIFDQTAGLSRMVIDTAGDVTFPNGTTKSGQFNQTGTSNPTIGAVWVEDAALDGNFQAITLANFVTQLAFAPLASPHFTGTPTAPTPAVGNSSTDIATTAFANPASSATANGFVEFPSGIILQWGSVLYSNTTSAPEDGTVTFPIVFPNAIFAAVVNTERSLAGAGGSQAANGSNFVANLTTSGMTVTLDTSPNAGSNVSAGWWFAVGN